ILEQARSNRILAAVAGLPIGGLEAMRGRFDEARALFAQSRASFEEFGLELWVAALPQWSGPAELLAGEPGRAEQQLREGYESLRAMGDRGLLSPVAAFLAQALYAQGRYEEAEELAAESAECASRDDLFPHVAWRGARAKALARRGDKVAAEGLAREAVALAGETDSLNLQGDAWADLAEVLASEGEENEASSCIERALGLYEAKGNVISAAHARARLATAGRSA
ncbi:MAG: tetratricopeptide repeat protein, partial [Gaiellaceae bacterium]